MEEESHGILLLSLLLLILSQIDIFLYIQIELSNNFVIARFSTGSISFNRYLYTFSLIFVNVMNSVYISRLRVLNVSNNQLVTLHSACSSLSPTPDLPLSDHEQPTTLFRASPGHSKPLLTNLEEFYGGCNSLTELTALQHCHQLRALHVPYNELTTISHTWEITRKVLSWR